MNWLIWIIIFILLLAFTIRYRFFPWQTDGSARAVRTFWFFTLILTFIAPISILVNDFADDGPVDGEENIPSEDEMEQWIYEGNHEALQENARADEYSFSFDGDSLFFEPYIDGLGDIQLFVEESADLDNEIHILHAYPLVAVEGYDLSHVFPTAEYEVQEEQLIYYGEERASVGMTSYTNDFVVNQFARDREPVGEPFDVNVEPMMVLLEVPEGVEVERGEAGSEGDIHIHRSIQDETEPES